MARMDDPAGLSPPPGARLLFLGFLTVGVIAFGGAMPMARRMIVEQRRWLTPAEFTDLLALCQFLPGPNVVNLTVAVGRRFGDLPGAVAALAGLIAAPMAIAVALATAYARYGEMPGVRHGFAGLAAAASGLVLAMAVKIAWPLRHSRLGLTVAAVSFAAVALVRLPLWPAMLVLVPASILLHRRWPT